MSKRISTRKAPKTKEYKFQKEKQSVVDEPTVAYGKHKESDNVVFTIKRKGLSQEYIVNPRFGYFITSLKKASTLSDVSQLLEKGIPSKGIQPVIDYIGFTVPEVAKAAGVSPSTVSRWLSNTSIGVSGSSQFFKIDEVIRKGVELFGSEQELKTWLESPNLALGNQIPARILISPIGVDLVDEALDALDFGNFM